MTEQIREKFKSLQKIGDLNTVIKYLSELLETADSDKLRGFCFWNISDTFAMLRKSDELYKNHRLFKEFATQTDTKYLLWCVCDATQKFTLEFGGYGDFWWEIYCSAIKKTSHISNIESVTFEVHNAALSINPKVEASKNNLCMVADNFKNFIERTETSKQSVFYKVVYSALCLKAFESAEYDILNLCDKLFPWLKCDFAESPYAVGEWERLNSPRSKHNMAQVGINRAINALIDVGKKTYARELYNEALNNRLTRNIYIEKRL